ncbi:MAG: imidazoleglycerol-phosphate dehydratase HisB [Puniceicoccaceae bacterium]
MDEALTVGRFGEVSRATGETQITVQVNLDGSGQGERKTGIPFFDHMLDLFARHGFCDLTVDAKGDLEVDYHHLVEDVGLALGTAIRGALGDRGGIRRYGSQVLPMDETLVSCAIDLGNRPYLVYEVSTSITFVRDFNIQLFKEFFQALAVNAGMNLHLKLEYGSEPHHIAEGCFKAFARAFDAAKTLDPRLQGTVPSTKGTLSEDG